MTDGLKIAIAGIAGRMGRQLAAASVAGGHQLVGGTERPGSDALALDLGTLAGGGPPLGLRPTPSPAEAAQAANVWIDFTAPAATLSALDALTDAHPSDAGGVTAVIIGTTGFDANQQAAINAHAGRFAIVQEGNFSLGVNLLTAVTQIVAARLGADWDAEVAETHHRHKADAPSGTALMLGAAIAAGRGTTLDAVQADPYQGPDARRAPGAVGFSVRRSGGVVGDHSVSFASETEIVALSHRALDRSVFADGALAAAKWAVRQPPGRYGMADVLGLATPV